MYIFLLLKIISRLAGVLVIVWERSVYVSSRVVSRFSGLRRFIGNFYIYDLILLIG